ncbi:class II fructose-bisphosphate aldolase [Diplocloster agilis]|uniref:Class II fructose-bisphosphate aldolase n=1 Tax=Diplocloster agilis TaxID=2850323 RepID=A0A949K1X0_9FIRM|nr:class II fructose-bisphosphate aldolase [Diplocloster agilis]MBU9734991.1 class II fructose-bisphosphate aldolase [Diplocloster agilis]MBU9742483.1 class II fructose-bisphosphate aldolase [Diplocloster agilis]
MLVTMKEILDHANTENYGVAAPNFFCEVDARAALEAAEDLNAPIILDISYKNSMDIIFTGSYVLRLAEQAKVPVALNLDHGQNLTHAVTAIRAGFTSMMIDRSMLDFEENVRQVKKLVEIAHSVDMSVEAELGHVGKGERYQSKDCGKLTDPEDAKRFVEQTGVDCLAVSIGTAHGSYQGEPRIDFERLSRIKERVAVPLVIHGASGTGRDKLAEACRLGINKVNINNDLLQAAYEEIIAHDMSGNGAYGLWKHLKNGYKQRLMEYIQLFGGAGKAWQSNQHGLIRKEISLVE